MAGAAAERIDGFSNISYHDQPSPEERSSSPSRIQSLSNLMETAALGAAYPVIVPIEDSEPLKHLCAAPRPDAAQHR
jgi:hypothetical protein